MSLLSLLVVHSIIHYCKIGVLYLYCCCYRYHDFMIIIIRMIVAATHCMSKHSRALHPYLTPIEPVPGRVVSEAGRTEGRF